MIEVENPKVFLIAEPQINTEGMLAYLRAVGGEAWWERVGAKIALGGVPAAEGLVEFCGRLCYRSWEKGLNANVSRIREDRGEYLLNILRSGHGSVLCHAHFTFAIHDCSRVLTAELNRHAVGTDISEQSLRFVRLDELRFRTQNGLKPQTQRIMGEMVRRVEETMAAMMRIEGLDDPAMDFTEKKRVTSALRRLAPLGLATEEVWSGNIRSIRHVTEMRSSRHAEEEIRVFADQVGLIMRERCPLLFADYDRSDDGEWTTEYRKV